MKKEPHNPIENFSALDIAMGKFQDDLERRRLMEPAKPFEPAEMTPVAKSARLKASKKDYWAFDKYYFTEDMYSDGYSKPGWFQKFIITLMFLPGVHILLGPRKHAKTATAKKGFVWLMLTRLKFAATLSSTLPVSRNILADIAELLHNPRIVYDYGIQFEEENADQITFRIEGVTGLKRIIALSEKRSARGATFGFARPQFVLCDDLETLQSPLGSDHTENRINILSETFQSLSNSACILVLGNNFDERTAYNRLLTEQQEGILDENWKVHVVKAWEGKKPLWKERFPAKTENELKKLVKCRTETEWLAEFQQSPVPPDGMIFKRHEKIPSWSVIPADARGILYCDPNLSKKGRGDSTAIVSLLYSVSTENYYISKIRCRSFSDSNVLLDAVFKIKDTVHRCLGWDGHVNQESTWSMHVRNWCAKRYIPFPRIQYCRYNVDELAKNAQAAWNEGKILLPPDIGQSEEGKRFLTQMFSFAGKKANRADDAPDGVICAFELIHERKLGERTKSRIITTVIQDYYF